MRRNNGVLVFETDDEERGQEESEELFNGFEGIVVTHIPKDSSIYQEDSLACQEMYFSSEKGAIDFRLLGKKEEEEIPFSKIRMDCIPNFLTDIQQHIAKRYAEKMKTRPKKDQKHVDSTKKLSKMQFFYPEIAIDSELEALIVNQ